MAGVQGGDPEAADPADQLLPRVVGIEGAELGLNRAGPLELVLVVGLVEDPGEAHHGVGVHQAGGHGPGGEHPVAGGDLHFGGGADPLDPSVGAHEHHPVAEGSARHGVHRLGPDGELGRRGDRRGDEQQGRERGQPDGIAHQWPSIPAWWSSGASRTAR